MKTQDTDTAGGQVTAPSPVHPKRHGRWAGIAAVVVVVILIGLSVLVFAQLRQRQANQAPTPSSGQWKQVLEGYSLTSIVAARSNPGVLYACASQAPGVSSQSSPATFTVLRSADFGDHWQDIGSKAALSNFCQLAVNPANGNEIYVVSAAPNSQSSGLLKHSTDGGQSWETIQPVLHAPGIQPPVLWFVQQIQFEGNHLFGLQWITPGATPINQPARVWPYLLPRLVTSVDGGHNWTIIDSQFSAQKLGVHSYTVDPTDPNTIYALLGGSLLPVEATTPQAVPSYFGLYQELFKTTDGGASWHLLLQNIPFGSQVQLASGNPQLIYVGGTISPLPLLRNETEPAFPIPIGSFHLQVSTNGGATWQEVAIPSDMLSIQNWYVDPDGQVYASPTLPFSGQPTAVAGTVVPITPVPRPTVKPRSSSVGAQSIDAAIYPQTVPVTASQFIRSYDPTSKSWSDLTRPPTAGFLLQVTPAHANSGAVLWFMGTINEQATLYRFVV